MTTAPTSPAEQPLDPALKRLTLILVLGALAPALDTTIVNVALAAIGKGLHTSICVDQPVDHHRLICSPPVWPCRSQAWATERIGPKRPMADGRSVLFTLGSALSGAAWDVTSLVIFRILQGSGRWFDAPPGR